MTPLQTKEEFSLLKEYIDSRFKGLEDVLDVRLASIETKLGGLNGLAKEANTHVTKEDCRYVREEVRKEIIQNEVKIGLLEKEIGLLRESRAEINAKASQTQTNIVTLISIVGVVIALLSIFLK